MNGKRIIALLTMAILLGMTGVAIAHPSSFQAVALPGLEDNSIGSASVSITSGGILGIGATTTTYQVFVGMNLVQSAGTPLQWSTNPGTVYSVSVPSSSLTTETGVSPQSTQVEITPLTFEQNGQVVSNPYNQIVIANYVAKAVYIPVDATSGQEGTPIVMKTWTGTTDTVNGANLPSFAFDKNTTNAPYYSMSGIMQFTLDLSANFNGTSFNWPQLYAEQYVVPGMGTFNSPSQTVGGGKPVTISGTVNYGTFALQITGPNGTNTIVNLGNFASYNNPFSYTFTPSQLGIYTVVLSNSMVGLTQTQVINVKNLLITPPTIIIDTTTKTGFYSNGQTVKFTLIEAANGSQITGAQFNLLIYNGVTEPLSGSGDYYYNQNVPATYSNGNYTFSGQFTINPNGQALGKITIVATLVSNSYQIGSPPSSLTISVGYNNYHPPTYLMDEIGIAGLIAAGLVTAFDRDPLRWGVLISGVIMFAVFLGVPILG